jgi:type VI secretion system secreted protein VgrG
VKFLVALLLTVFSLEIGALAQTTITLGTADDFALLGGSAITNAGGALTYIIGDVGSSPTPAVTGLTQSQVAGMLFLAASPVTAAAQKGLTVGYDQAEAAPCTINLTGEDLGGMTLGPGVYCFSSSAQLTGALKLDAYGNADAQWIFQIGSTLTTASDSTVSIVLGHAAGNEATPLWKKELRGGNVYWQVGSSATIGTGNVFLGQILAHVSITLDGGTLKGKALASTGAVTMSDQETVNGPSCN